jgi:DNA-binding PadR family transcriptional regulator
MQRGSRLGFALLGMLQENPASGYDVRKIFSSSSMKTYSDSPGAIYPALARLEKQGMIQGRIEQGSGMRRRQVFRVTPRGLAELRKWIRRPITRDDLVSRQPEIVLRFAFCDNAVGPAASVEFLHSLQAELKIYIASLHQEFNTLGKLMPTSARLAFEAGIRGTEGFLAWAHHALVIYEKLGHKKLSHKKLSHKKQGKGSSS